MSKHLCVCSGENGLMWGEGEEYSNMDRFDGQDAKLGLKMIWPTLYKIKFELSECTSSLYSFLLL